MIERKLDIKDFKGITLGNSAQVFLSPGDRIEVRVEGQENIIANLTTDVSGGVWRIGFKKPVSHAETLRIYITMDQLLMAKISGSGNISGQGLFKGGRDLELGVSGSGNIHLDVEADDIEATISGSGNIRVSGKASGLNLGISGSGNMDFRDLKADEASVRISGSGGMKMNVTELLEARISGSGDVRYTGRPRVNTSISGSGRVRSE